MRCRHLLIFWRIDLLDLFRRDLQLFDRPTWVHRVPGWVLLSRSWANGCGKLLRRGNAFVSFCHCLRNLPGGLLLRRQRFVITDRLLRGGPVLTSGCLQLQPMRCWDPSNRLDAKLMFGLQPRFFVRSGGTHRVNQLSRRKFLCRGCCSSRWVQSGFLLCGGCSRLH